MPKGGEFLRVVVGHTGGLECHALVRRCPFCFGVPTFEEGGPRVRCSSCGVLGPRGEHYAGLAAGEAAILAWNSRPVAT